ncbi:hypothetical protein [Hymenobacter crusticola]|uniref:Uncharacterized protein n=1 Tax=Hymenobacter crusticola TaxID=1770526 RepID=A0A2C9ZV77_9BACT|nr:hypothetical protein [Hymenobacter crusticola]OUJ68038.1 hypothetical protein BXP70_28220 [Hymenobacter crusticola]
MNKLFFIASCLLVLSSSPTWAQQAPEVVTVRIKETANYVDLTTATDGKAADWRRIKFTAKEDDDERTAEEVEKVVNTYYQQGFTIQAVVPGYIDASTKTTTLIFVKPAKS